MAQSSNLKRVKKYEPSQFATEFCELYCSIIPKLYNVECDLFLEGAKRELKNIRRLKHFITSKEEINFLCDIKFEEIAVRCAYMYAYSVLYTSVAYREFSKHLEENSNEEMLLQHFSSKTLKLCCLGGGAGFEAVGVSKAISDVIWKSNWREVRPPVDVHITIVDICSEWKSEQSAIMKELNKKSCLFHSEKVNFKAEFYQADLLKPFEETLKDIIKEANIITVAKFASALAEKNQKNCIPNVQSMMKRVIDCMAEESCLFMLDSAGGAVFYRSVNVASQCKSDFKLQLIKHKAYRLHPKTLQTLEGVLNFRGFVGRATLFPTQLTRVSSCIWVKKPLQKKKTKANKEKAQTEKLRKGENEEESREKRNEEDMLRKDKITEEKLRRRREKREAKLEKKRIQKLKMKEEIDKIKVQNERIKLESEIIKEQIRKENNEEEVTGKESNEGEMPKKEKIEEEKKRRRKANREARIEKKRIEKQKMKEENEKRKGETENIKEDNKKDENNAEKTRKENNEGEMLREEIEEEKGEEMVRKEQRWAYKEKREADMKRIRKMKEENENINVENEKIKEEAENTKEEIENTKEEIENTKEEKENMRRTEEENRREENNEKETRKESNEEEMLREYNQRGEE